MASKSKGEPASTRAEQFTFSKGAWLAMAEGEGEAAKAIRSAIGTVDGDGETAVTLQSRRVEGKLEYVPFFGIDVPAEAPAKKGRSKKA